jgi:HSP20 family protein
MATLVRWEPFREIATLQNEMSRLMNTFAGGDGETSRSWVPALDVWETEGEIVYALDLPGIAEDDISIEFEDGSLTVTAERERRNEVPDDKLYRYERRFGTYTRTFGLPQGVAEDQIKAECHNGVLEIHVAKPEQAKPRRIQIGGSERKMIEGKAKRA